MENLKDIVVWYGSQSVRHWVSSENEFVYEGVNYERDPENGRCYRLVDSCNLRPEWDGALVKQRISAKEYQETYELAVDAVKTYELWRMRIKRKA